MRGWGIVGKICAEVGVSAMRAIPLPAVAGADGHEQIDVHQRQECKNEEHEYSTERAPT